MENNDREYKRELTDDIEKSVVAFLNAVGGEIFVGVDNSGRAVGLAGVDKAALRLADRIKDNISPSAMGLDNRDRNRDRNGDREQAAL